MPYICITITNKQTEIMVTRNTKFNRIVFLVVMIITFLILGLS